MAADDQGLVSGPPVALRVAGRGDAAAVDDLLQRSYAELMEGAYAPAVLTAALPLIARANAELLAGGRYYLAIRPDPAGGETLLGAGGWSFEAPGGGTAEPGLAHIRHFAVDPGAVGQGIGRRLFEACRDAAVEAGARRLEVYASLNAVAFYARMGFVPVADLEIPLAPDLAFPAVHMTRDAGA